MAIRPTQNTDHAATAVARLPSYLQNRANWGKLFAAVGPSLDSLEAALFQLLTERAITNATEETLTQIGTILNYPKGGESVAEYRTALLARASVLGRSGEINAVEEGYSLIWESLGVTLSRVLLDEYQPATFIVTAVVDADDTSQDAATVEAMDRLRVAGVLGVYHVVVENEILFGSAADADVNGDLNDDADHGFGTSADADANGDITPGPGAGGNFARVL